MADINQLDNEVDSSLRERIARGLGYTSAAEASASKDADQFNRNLELASAGLSGAGNYPPKPPKPIWEKRQENAFPSVPEAAMPTPEASSGMGTAGETRMGEGTADQSGSVPAGKGTLEDTIASANENVKLSYQAPRKIADSALRDAMGQFDKAASELKQRDIDTSDIDADLAQARADLKAGSARRDILQLVEMIGQSIANLAAARYSEQTGRGILDRINQNRTDWESKGREAREEYKLTADALSEKGRRREKQAVADYQAARDRLSGLGERVRGEQFLYGKEMTQAEQEAEAANRAARDTAAAERDASRYKSADKKESDRTAAEIRKTAQVEHRNAVNEMREIAKREAAITGILNALSTDTSKDDTLIPKYASQAGVDMGQLEVESQEPGKLWGKNTNKEVMLSKVRAMIEEQRARKAEAEAVANRAKEMIRTGREPDYSAEPAPVREPEGSGQKEQPRAIVHKSGAKQPYSDALWKEIQADEDAKDYSLE